MTEPMDIPMFEVPAQRRYRADPSCGALGTIMSWTDLGREMRRAAHISGPVCNRMHDHDGPHRRYDTKARILAEWSQP